MSAGMAMMTDPSTAALGRFLVDQAQSKLGGASSMSATTKTGLEGDAVNAAKQLGRLRDIESEFDPKYLTAQSQIGTWWNGIKAKFNADQLGDDERDELITGYELPRQGA